MSAMRPIPKLFVLPGGQTHAREFPHVAPGDVEASFHAYSPYVARIALRLLGRDDEVDDVVQEVFLAAWRGLGEIREPAAVKGWLATITVRRAGRRLRLRRLRSFVGLDESANYSALAVGADQEQSALLARVYQALDHMPTELRMPWVLQKIEGEPLGRVAALCECSLATAKRRIAAAQTQLQTMVDDA